MFPLSAPDVEFEWQRQAILLWAAELVSVRREPGELFREIASRLRTVLPFDFVIFALCDPVRKIMKLYMWQGEGWVPETAEVSIEESAAGFVWRTQTALSIDNLA
jgi:hypothetical protein